VVWADRPFPPETTTAHWRLTRRREADDVNAEIRSEVDRNGYARIGLALSDIPTT
jgi:hypothetical protein